MHNKNTDLTNNFTSIKELLEQEIKRREVFSAIADGFFDLAKDYKEMIAFFARKIAEFSNDLSVIYISSDDDKNFDTTSSYHPDDKIRNELWELQNIFPLIISEGISAYVIKNGLPIIVPINGDNFNSHGLLSSEFNSFLEKYSFSVYLILPININNNIIGTLSLFRSHSDIPYKIEDQTFLQGIVNLLTSNIRNIQLYNEKERLVREIHHRLKNNLQVISSMLSIQSDYVRDKESHKLFVDSLNRIRTMSLIYENLSKANNYSDIDISKYMKDLVTYLYRTYNINTNLVKFNINIRSVSLPLDASITCGLIVNELISNAFKHAFPDGRSGKFKVSLIKSVNQIKLVVSDDGIGLPENMDIERNGTFGLLLIHTLVDQLNGTLQVIRTNGVKYIIRFPHSYN